jgi:hypothetical protein
MKTRGLYHIDLPFDIEHRTDGWYYRVSQSEEEWEGPFRNVGELSEEIAERFDEYIRRVYELLHKKAPP